MIAIRVESSCFHTSLTVGEEDKKKRGTKGDGEGICLSLNLGLATPLVSTLPCRTHQVPVCSIHN